MDQCLLGNTHWWNWSLLVWEPFRQKRDGTASSSTESLLGALKMVYQNLWLHWARYTAYTALNNEQAVHCTDHSVHYTLILTLYTYNVHNTLYSAQFTISCASLHVHCTLYTAHTPVKLQPFSQFTNAKLSNVPLLPSSTLCDAQWKIQKHTNFEYSRLVWKWATIWPDTIPKQTLYKYLFCFSLYSKGF